MLVRAAQPRRARWQPVGHQSKRRSALSPSTRQAPASTRSPVRPCRCWHLWWCPQHDGATFRHPRRRAAPSCRPARNAGKARPAAGASAASSGGSGMSAHDGKVRFLPIAPCSLPAIQPDTRAACAEYLSSRPPTCARRAAASQPGRATPRHGPARAPPAPLSRLAPTAVACARGARPGQATAPHRRPHDVSSLGATVHITVLPSRGRHSTATRVLLWCARGCATTRATGVAAACRMPFMWRRRCRAQALRATPAASLGAASAVAPLPCAAHHGHGDSLQLKRRRRGPAQAQGATLDCELHRGDALCGAPWAWRRPAARAAPRTRTTGGRPAAAAPRRTRARAAT